MDDVASISPDYFNLDPRLSARVPGAVEVTAFRLVFTGQTAALRALLNTLAAFELPVIVRSVEVEPAAGEDMLSDGGGTPSSRETVAEPPASTVLTVSSPAKSKPSTAAPLVAKSLSKFTVIVEFIDLVPPAPPVVPASS